MPAQMSFNSSEPTRSLSGAGLQTLGLGAAGLPIIAGISALVGWAADIELLRSIQPGVVSMNPATAICFILSGIILGVSLLLSPDNPLVSRLRWAAILPLTLGVAKLLSYLAGITNGPDSILFRQQLDADPLGPNRMAPNTAALFAIWSFSFFCTLRRDRTWALWVGRIVALGTAMYAILAILGYLNRVTTLYGVSTFIPMALPTAISFLALSSGLLLMPIANHRRQASVQTGVSDAGISVQQKVGIGFAGALIVLCVIGVASYASFVKVLADMRMNNEAHARLRWTERVAGQLYRVEAAGARFILEANDAQLKRLRTEADAMHPLVTQHRPPSGERVEIDDSMIRFESVVQARIGRIREAVAQAEAGGFQSAKNILTDTEHASLISETQASLEALRAEDMRHIAEREAQATFSARVTTAIILFGSVMAFLVVGLAAHFIRRDIARRAEAEAALFESETKHRFLADAMPQIIWAVQPDGTFDYFNQRWQEYTGKSLFEIRRDGMASVLHPDDVAGFNSEWNRSFGSGEEFEGEYRLRCRERNEYRWFLCRMVPRCDADGQILEWVGTWTDIRGQKQTATALEESRTLAESASQAKSQFLAHMSHEIRTPLNGVIGMTDLVLSTELGQQQRRYAELAKKSAESLASLINQILDFSKIESGKLELDSTDFDLHLLVEDAVQILAQKASEKSLELTCFVDVDVPRRVQGDPDRLRQILVNLLGNAVKFTREGTIAVVVTLESQSADESELRFAVTDSGVGIPRDRLDRLFKAFSQADASTTRNYGGTGLGLAISKQLAELMGGRIGVKSKPGRGSTFWFTARFGKRLQEASIARAAALNLEGMRVLAVDDNPACCETLMHQIECWGLDADKAVSGAEALERMRQARDSRQPFRIALIDDDMPGMTGADVARAIRTDPSIQDTVLLILVSMDQVFDPTRLRGLGFDGIMTKPIRQSQLFDAMMDALATADGAEMSLDVTPPPEFTDSDLALEGVRVLLAEDNEVNQILATELLRKVGCTVEIATTGVEAVSAVQAQAFDLVLMDCQMPEMDGFAATQAIRDAAKRGDLAEGSPAHLPILALTANAVKGDREACMDAGMDDYLTKPLSPQKLFAAIREHLTAEPPSPRKRPEETARKTQETPPDGQTAPFNIDGLMRRCGDNRALAKTLVQKFLQQGPSDIEAMASAVARGDASQLSLVAHRLKGAALAIEAKDVAAVSRQIEDIGRAGTVANAENLLAILQSLMEACRAFDLAECDTIASS